MDDLLVKLVLCIGVLLGFGICAFLLLFILAGLGAFVHWMFTRLNFLICEWQANREKGTTLVYDSDENEYHCFHCGYIFEYGFEHKYYCPHCGKRFINNVTDR